MSEIETFEKFIDIVKNATDKHEEEQAKAGGTMELIGSFYQRSHIENSHSEVLAYLLNPYAEHRHGGEYLKLFLKQIGLLDKIESFVGDWDNISVRREVSTDDGRIDILIQSTSFVIVIENKIWADDQPKQLSRYYESFKNTYKIGENLFMVYLTPYGDKASNDSKDQLQDEQIINVSYETHILTWLTQLPTKQNETLIRSAIEQYIYTVQKLMGSTAEEMSLMSDLKNELLKFINDEKNNIGLEDIKNLEKVMFDLVLEQTFIEIKRKLEEALRATPHSEIKYDTEGNWTGVYLPILNDNARIRFEVDRNNNKISYCYYGIHYEKKEEALPILNNIMENNHSNWHYLKMVNKNNIDIDNIVANMASLYQKIISNKS